MFAVQFDRFGPPSVLSIGDLPEPHAQHGQVRVRVQAAGVSPVDLALRAGTSPSSKALPLPHVPGVDAAGYVDEIGAGVTEISLGDEVFGTVDLTALGGASAEYAILAFWARKPASWAWEEAGAASSSVETATRALDKLGVRAGEVLLIDGASGGVGSVAVQLAVSRGITVIATGRDASHSFLTDLGAIPVSYGEGLVDRVDALDAGKVDFALGVSGKGSLPALIELTGRPAAVLSLADFSAPSHGALLSFGELAGEPSGKHGLAVAADLASHGRFRVPVQMTVPMSLGAQAHAEAEQAPRRGKVVMTRS